MGEGEDEVSHRSTFLMYAPTSPYPRSNFPCMSTDTALPSLSAPCYEDVGNDLIKNTHAVISEG